MALADVVRRRRRAPDVAGLVPHLGNLRAVAMPWPRVEVAELLVEHLVELGEQLDDLIVRIAVVSVDVVARPVPARPPGELDVLRPEEIAGRLDLRPVFQLERDVMHLGALATDEIDRVMVWAAAHEGKPVLDPIRQPEAKIWIQSTAGSPAPGRNIRRTS